MRNRWSRQWASLMLVGSLAIVASVATAQTASVEAAPSMAASSRPELRIGDYVGQDVMIPMRDGVRLHAQIWRPANAKGPLPFLIQRSPYGFQLEQVTASFNGQFKELAAEGFIFVLQDIRGRFGSEGDFVMLRPKAASGGVDESTDTFDSIEWLTSEVAGNNGAAGVFGISYGGWTAAMAAIDPHPALKAISVQAAPEDMFVGDDFHHNGAFRLDYAWEYSAALETDGRTMKVFDFGKEDPFAWFLRQENLADLDQATFGRPLPTWRNFVNHPDYDDFWREMVTSRRMPARVAVPNLIVAGWWDQEDFYGPLKIYQAQEAGDADDRNFLVVGPWNHGGWARGSGRTYGPVDLGSATGDHFRANIQLPWFRHWLKGEGRLDQPEALIFQTGANQWRRYSSWPLVAGTESRKLYLHAGGVLSFSPPDDRADASPDRFISDPADPVPYRERPIAPVLKAGSTWPQWQADDQAPFGRRKDVLTWRTEPLTQDVTITGKVTAELFASTTGTDADWVVKLIDVYPSDESVAPELRGRETMITQDVFRARYREGFETPRPVKPNAVLKYPIDLHSASHVFRKGHRIEVQVQSSWFPLIDRNPQTFVPNILEAKPGDFKVQTHAIHHDGRAPSAIAVQVETAAPRP